MRINVEITKKRFMLLKIFSTPARFWLRALDLIGLKMSCNVVPEMPTSLLRLSQRSGFGDRKNDIVYAPPINITQGSRVVIFFPGDVQDYVENMEAHRDNTRHKQWNLEDTALKLQKKFPEGHILVIKPVRMNFKTFSCFQNFVNCNDIGVPDHSSDHNGLRHLNCLLESVSKDVKSNLGLLNLTIIGFSKGCVVLNQFLHEFHNFTSEEKNGEMLHFIRRIKDMYWLDGGHPGGKDTWVNDQDILKTLVSFGIKVHVHVTPYQIEDDRRPWIKKEEKTFSDILAKNGCQINRIVHFESVPPSILTHFDVINVF